nr:MAG TPA: hypothetical protein [Caudoviricetes sp.]
MKLIELLIFFVDSPILYLQAPARAESTEKGILYGTD